MPRPHFQAGSHRARRCRARRPGSLPFSITLARLKQARFHPLFAVCSCRGCCKARCQYRDDHESVAGSLRQFAHASRGLRPRGFLLPPAESLCQSSTACVPSMHPRHLVPRKNENQKCALLFSPASRIWRASPLSRSSASSGSRSQSSYGGIAVRPEAGQRRSSPCVNRW